MESAMPLQTCCPSCGASYTLADDLLGKKARCKECRAYFVIAGHVVPAEGRGEVEVLEDDAAVQAGPSAPPSPPAPEDPVVRAEVAVPDVRKKRRRKPAVDHALRRRIILAATVAGVALVAFVLGLALLIAWSRRGPDVVGRWKGAPAVRDQVEGGVKDARMHPVAEHFIGAIAQMAANEMLAVQVQFKKDGAVFYSGNTGCLGIANEADGRWEEVRRQGDVVFVRMGPRNAPYEARLVFEDRDTFSLTRTDSKDAPVVLFTRVKD
jgi:hypothetical protein